MFQRETDPITKSYFYKYGKNILYSPNIKKITHIFIIVLLRFSIFHNLPIINDQKDMNGDVVRVNNVAPHLLDHDLILKWNTSLSKPARGLLMKERPECVRATSHDLQPGIRSHIGPNR